MKTMSARGVSVAIGCDISSGGVWKKLSATASTIMSQLFNEGNWGVRTKEINL